jgi:hypothetical protein
MALTYVELFDKDGNVYKVLTDTIDEVSNAHAQVFKPAFGADTDVTVVDAGDPLPIQVSDGTTAATVVDTGGTHDGLAVSLIDADGDAIGLPNPVVVTSSTITGNTSAYAALDAYHSGYLTFTDAANVSGGTGHILNARLYDTDAVEGSFRLWLFNTTVTGTTLNTQLSVSDADVVKTIGYLDFSEYADGSASAFAMADKATLPLPFDCSGSANLYGILQCTSSPTFTTTTPLSIKLHIAQD